MTFFMNIGQLAKEVGLTAQTLRFYEREGLLLPPHRHGSGNYRDYDESALSRIRFIVSAKKAGFTLKNIKEIIDVRLEDKPCSRVAALVTERMSELDQRIEELRCFREHLALLHSECKASENPQKCPAIDSFVDDQLHPRH